MTSENTTSEDNTSEDNTGPFAGDISRRDFVHGVALAGASALVPSTALADAVAAASAPGSPSQAPTGSYPPGLDGLRGNHDGSWETAHQLARHGETSFGPIRETGEADYDLIVVGGGISGLSAAYFLQQQNPDANILILDNHDDFGGHAKRNEFEVGGRKLLGYGGSQTMQEPSSYPPEVKTMLKDLGVTYHDFDDAYDNDFFIRHELAGGVFFSEKDWGRSALVKFDLNNFSDFMPMAQTTLPAEQAVASMPLSTAAKAQLLRVLTETRDCLPDMGPDEKEAYLYSISYKTFLERHLGVTEPEVFRLMQNSTYEMSIGFDSVPAATALDFYALPGRGATGIPYEEEYFEPYIHHFPDGNASVARLLVQRLLPHLNEAEGMYETLGEHLDYSRLDMSDANVRLRLSSTVVNVSHVGDPATAKTVDVTYVRNGSAERARGKHVVLACYHSIIPALCPELPEAQRDAMASQVKAPILYTNVALNNWHAWKEMGVGAFIDPTGYHINAMLDFPVSLGDYRFAETPDDPVVVHMERFPYGAAPGMAKRDRLRAGRYELLSTPFDTIERQIREQLSEALGPGGFKEERDIAAITVNRWAHGYSYFYDVLEETFYDAWDDPRWPHVQARQPYGRITIANTDADANAMLEAAIIQGHRAVQELS